MLDILKCRADISINSLEIVTYMFIIHLNHLVYSKFMYNLATYSGSTFLYITHTFRLWNPFNT